MKLTFEFNPDKAASNLARHRVSFQQAMTVFGDPLAQTFPDELHSDEEERWITLGVSSDQRLLFVSHLEADNVIRLIGARDATAAERYEYEEHKSGF
jgi:uncharacterized DUF497 family protein